MADNLSVVLLGLGVIVGSAIIVAVWLLAAIRSDQQAREKEKQANNPQIDFMDALKASIALRASRTETTPSAKTNYPRVTVGRG